MPFRVRLAGSKRPEFGERATLTGQVLDKKGQPVFDAQIVLHPPRKAKREPITVRTNREGIYLLPLVPPGEYKIACRVFGAERCKRQKLTLEAGQHLRTDLKAR